MLFSFSILITITPLTALPLFPSTMGKIVEPIRISSLDRQQESQITSKPGAGVVNTYIDILWVNCE